jgi:hypothetical protein
MISRIGAGICLAGFATITVAMAAPSRGRSSPDKLIAHEWGTFTTVAGEDGRAIEWLPLNGPTDLPCFVEHYKNSNNLKILPTEDVRLIDYETARSRLWGKVRMETPVLYLYGPKEMRVGVKVRFPRGLLSEWYPHANSSSLGVTPTVLHHPQFETFLEWPSIALGTPANEKLPIEPGKSHYYAARATEANSLRVGSQNEKFLFYRGVANFDVPLTVRANKDGGVEVTNLGAEPIPNVVLFERRGSTFGYRVGGSLGRSMTLAAPQQNASLDALRADLEKMLIGAGLYPREAAAMLETWRDSWFEDGTRVFYIIPPRTVDAILPLTVNPAPASIARVFVGRMEVLTQNVQQTVETAITRNDATTLERYARFLGPISDRILAKPGVSTSTAAATKAATAAAYTSYVRRASTVCE